jgi:DNA-binding beta-propeller fold protein YncE
MQVGRSSLNKVQCSRHSLCILLIAEIFVAMLSLSSCGGGGGGSSSSQPPPPDFSLVFQQASVSLQPQGVSQGQAISATPANGFTGTINLTVSGLPTGVTMTPGSLPGLVITGSGTGAPFELAASPTATVGTNTITVTGTSGSISHSTTFSLVVAAAAPFTIQVSPKSLALTPSLNGTAQVTVIPSPGTSPSLGIQVTQAPQNSGINIVGPQGFLTPTNPVQILVEAGVLAQPVQNFPIVVTATDNANNSYVVIVPLTVSVASTPATPTRSTFARTDWDPTGVVYDEARKLLFVSVEVLNQIAVLSSTDGHRVATIPVQYPAGIDESVDGSAVYVVSPYLSYITTIDPNLLEVVRQTNIPQTGSGQTASAFQLVTLSNGDVLFLPNQAPTGPTAYLWNPVTNLFTGLNQQSLQNLTVIARSADHSKALIYNGDSAGSTAVIYDPTTGNLTGPARLNGIYALALNTDGSQIVGAGGQGLPTIFYDGQFNALGSTSLDVLSIAGVLYSLDGSHVYVLETDSISGDDVAAAIDTNSFGLVGVVPSFAFGSSLPFSGAVNVAFAIDETNMLFGPAPLGVGYLDVTSPGSFDLPFSYGNLMSPTLLNLAAPSTTQLQGGYLSSTWNYNVYFGPPPASPQAQPGTNISVQSSNTLDVTAPTGTVAGSANVTLTRSDGYFQVIPEAVSYGPSVLQVDANAGSPSGGDSIKVVGFGFDSSNVQVTIGGQVATNISRSGPTAGQIFPTATLSLTTPAGASGYADVTVATPNGSSTVSSGFQYLTSAQMYPSSGSAFDDIAYDETRRRLYITNQNHNRVEIFDLGTKSYLSPIAVGNQPTALALTPDGARLAVVNSADVTMSVIDPSALQVLSTFTVVPAQDPGCNVPLNMSPAEPHRMLLNLACPATLDGGVFHLVNLDTGSLSCTGVAGCQSNGTDMGFGNCCGLAETASTPDGNLIFLASAIGGPVGMLNLTANTITFGFSGTFSDAAANSDGNTFAASFGIANAQLFQAAIMAYERYADAGNESLHNVIGEKLNPSGSLLFVPQNTGVDIFDVHTGRLVQHVAIADGIPLNNGAMVLDETGTKMFLISNSGITIAQLFQAPLSLASANPAAGSPGTQVTLRGSGFQNGALVSFGTSQAATAYVDAETLTATVPAMSAGPVRITVKNPGGQTYDFDDAFTVQ